MWADSPHLDFVRGVRWFVIDDTWGAMPVWSVAQVKSCFGAWNDLFMPFFLHARQCYIVVVTSLHLAWWHYAMGMSLLSIILNIFILGITYHYPPPLTHLSPNMNGVQWIGVSCNVIGYWNVFLMWKHNFNCVLPPTGKWGHPTRWLPPGVRKGALMLWELAWITPKIVTRGHMEQVETFMWGYGVNKEGSLMWLHVIHCYKTTSPTHACCDDCLSLHHSSPLVSSEVDK